MRRLAALDVGLGLTALALLIVGFARALFFAKGWAFYAHNLAFWAKVALFTALPVLAAAMARGVGMV